MEESKGKITENKLTVFRSFALEVGCTLIIQENLPHCLDVKLKKGLPGVYIQLRKRGEIYIGEACDILDRQKEHLHNGVRLAALAILPTDMMDMQGRKNLETSVIASAQKRGLRLANKSKVKLAEELNRRKEYLSVSAAVQKLDRMDEYAVFQFGQGGWLETLEEAKNKATASDWERYMNFRESRFSHEALLLITTYVRRVIPDPELNYGKTWCITLNESGCPAPQWIIVNTQAGSVFCVNVHYLEEGAIVKAEFRLEKRRLDLLLERSNGSDEEMQIMLGITHGHFDLKRNYCDLQKDTTIKTYPVSSGKVSLEMDLDQALEFFQSPIGVAMISGRVDSINGKEVGEGFRLGRLFF